MAVPLLLLLDEDTAHVGWPVVGWGFCFTAKSSLQLARVEQVPQRLRLALARKYDFRFRLVVDEHLEALVEHALAPAHMRIERSEQEVHEVGLAQVAKGQDLLPWDTCRRHIVQIHDRDPLLNLPW